MNATVKQDATRYQWPIDEMCGSTPGIRHAILVTGDGLLMVTSSDLDTDLAERTAAMVSGLQSLSFAGSEFVSGRKPKEGERVSWSQTFVEYGSGYFVIMAAGQNGQAAGSYLAVAAAPDADMGAVADKMEETVERFSHKFAVKPRAEGDDGS